MSKEKSAGYSSPDNWQTETLRLTLFPSPAVQLAPEAWWTELLGEPSERQLIQPKLGIRQEQGAFGTGRLIMSVDPTRIDWRYTRVARAKVMPDAVPQLLEFEQSPTLGSLDTAVDAFSEVMFRWLALDVCPPARRLAFGAVLVQEVGSIEAGLVQLSKFLATVEIDLEGTRDFLYQVNRPRRATFVPELEINRLSKWSVGKWNVEFELSDGRKIAPYPIGTISRLELDINTSGEYEGELDRQQLGEAFEELVNLGKEIAAKGDIR